MNFQLKKLDFNSSSREKTTVLVMLVSDEALKSSRTTRTSTVAWMPRIQKAIAEKAWDTQAGGVMTWYAASDIAADWLVVAGIGKGSPKELRKAVHAAVGAVKSQREYSLTLVLPGECQTSESVATVFSAVADASYVFTSTKPSQKPRKLDKVVIGVESPTALQEALLRSQGLVAGVELAKEWANRPANHARPQDLARTAREIAARCDRMSCEVLGPQQVLKLKMGSFMSVAQGSEEPLRFIILKYKGAARSKAPVVLVGKGITFDTGGISLKPGAEMDEMKFDMCGAASVLGTFEALSRIQPAINVVGLIPACDNMPSGKATKPGDVVTSMSGQTIEVLNTDAEGRLILCDALTYAERFKPCAVIDIATLTGACVIALGAVRHGLFSADDGLAKALEQAGQRSADPCWRMPMDDEYGEGLKSNFADVANVAGRAAGSVTAAKFLQRFARAYPWAHLDIAGTAWRSGSAKGATGRPVPLLIDYLLDKAEPASSRRV